MSSAHFCQHVSNKTLRTYAMVRTSNSVFSKLKLKQKKKKTKVLSQTIDDLLRITYRIVFSCVSYTNSDPEK